MLLSRAFTRLPALLRQRLRRSRGHSPHATTVPCNRSPLHPISHPVILVASDIHCSISGIVADI
jgi:hypothetical protein